MIWLPPSPPWTDGMETSQLPPSWGQTQAPGSLSPQESTGQVPCAHHRGARRSAVAPTRHTRRCCGCSLRAAPPDVLRVAVLNASLPRGRGRRSCRLSPSVPRRCRGWIRPFLLAEPQRRWQHHKPCRRAALALSLRLTCWDLSKRFLHAPVPQRRAPTGPPEQPRGGGERFAPRQRQRSPSKASQASPGRYVVEAEPPPRGLQRNQKGSLQTQ